MFEAKRHITTTGQIIRLTETVYHTTVRRIRQQHGNAVIGLALSILQTVMFIAAFWLMFEVLGTRGMSIRGSFLLYLLTGIFLYLTHIRSLMAVLQAEDSTSPMMQHAPMNSIVAILSGAFSALYLQSLALIIILFVIHTLFDELVIANWAMTLFMFILSWAAGCAIGIILRALRPWIPDIVGIVQSIYIRLNMIASGKMFVANTLPGHIVVWFDWNPLFHMIDQARGYTFVNYFPHWSNWQYPLYATLALGLLGLMGEFYTRARASASWGATR